MPFTLLRTLVVTAVAAGMAVPPELARAAGDTLTFIEPRFLATDSKDSQICIKLGFDVGAALKGAVTCNNFPHLCHLSSTSKMTVAEVAKETVSRLEHTLASGLPAADANKHYLKADIIRTSTFLVRYLLPGDKQCVCVEKTRGKRDPLGWLLGGAAIVEASLALSKISSINRHIKRLDDTHLQEDALIASEFKVVRKALMTNHQNILSVVRETRELKLATYVIKPIYNFIGGDLDYTIRQAVFSNTLTEELFNSTRLWNDYVLWNTPQPEDLSGLVYHFDPSMLYRLGKYYVNSIVPEKLRMGGMFCFPRTTAQSMWVVARPTSLGIFTADMTAILRPVLPPYVAYPAIGKRDLKSIRYFVSHECDPEERAVRLCRATAFSDTPSPGHCAVPPTESCTWEGRKVSPLFFVQVQPIGELWAVATTMHYYYEKRVVYGNHSTSGRAIMRKQTRQVPMKSPVGLYSIPKDTSLHFLHTVINGTGLEETVAPDVGNLTLTIPPALMDKLHPGDFTRFIADLDHKEARLNALIDQERDIVNSESGGGGWVVHGVGGLSLVNTVGMVGIIAYLVFKARNPPKPAHADIVHSSHPC